MDNDLLRLDPRDDVAVALRELLPGETLRFLGQTLTVGEHTIPFGHKIALRDIAQGAEVRKYGCPIGTATAAIARGAWVHTHNLTTTLTQERAFSYTPHALTLPAPAKNYTFEGFLRADGSVGTRNELWILPTVGCVAQLAQQLAAAGQKLLETLPHGSVSGVYAFPHPFGCSQLGDDQGNTLAILADMARHPNAGGVLVLGLGCENCQSSLIKEELRGFPTERIRFMTAQDVTDEHESGLALLKELLALAKDDRRVTLPVSKLTLGLKCGGSDGLSGITANPLIGMVSDRLLAAGGSAILTEVPEMFGAEQGLFDRCINHEVYEKALAMTEGFKAYYRAAGQSIYENPSPGNKKGGITTLEEKSLGCTQKAGHAPVADVLAYAQRMQKKGLSLLAAPGNDLAACTALACAGAQLTVFSTGRGTPLGSPAPVLKIASNTPLAQRKPHWIDFDAGRALHGESLESLADALFAQLLRTASGEITRSEQNGDREFALWKTGVML